MKKVTLVFYEYPAAKHMIDDWEKSMYEQITSKQDRNSLYPKQFLYFHLKQKNECVFCWPINNFDISDVHSMVSKHGEYHKTLIFGRVEMNELEKIQRTITYMSIEKV